MRKIEVKKWKEYDNEGKEQDSDTLKALSFCLNMGLDRDKLAGWDKARMVNAIDKAFVKANKSGHLDLEETHYSFIKGFVERHTPPLWGGSKDIMGALDLFMEAKSE